MLGQVSDCNSLHSTYPDLLQDKTWQHRLQFHNSLQPLCLDPAYSTGIRLLQIPASLQIWYEEPGVLQLSWKCNVFFVVMICLVAGVVWYPDAG